MRSILHVFVSCGLLLVMFFIIVDVCGQGYANERLMYRQPDFADALDSLRKAGNYRVLPAGDPLEVSAYIALSHYPELNGHTIKIKYKKNVRHPVTASWSFGNLFRLRKHHVYVLLLSAESFVNRLDLNRQVGVIGHEMAHFAYYKQRSAPGMAWWGIKYITSKKFRYQFEKDADRTTVDHGLGWQLLHVSFYLSRDEVRDYMKQKGYKTSQEGG